MHSYVLLDAKDSAVPMHHKGHAASTTRRQAFRSETLVGRRRTAVPGLKGLQGIRGSVEASVRHVCLVVVIVPVVSRVKFHRRTFRYESCVEVSRDSCHVHGFENGGREHVENPDSHITQPVAISLGKPYMSGLSRNGFCRYFDFCVQNISTGNQKIKKVPTTNVFYSHNVLEFPRISHSA